MEDYTVSDIRTAEQTIRKWRSSSCLDADSDHEFVRNGEQGALSSTLLTGCAMLYYASHELGFVGRYANNVFSVVCLSLMIAFLITHLKYRKLGRIFDRYSPQSFGEIASMIETTEQIDGEGLGSAGASPSPSS